MDSHTRVRMNDGNLIPIIGYGTYQAVGEKVVNGVYQALMNGYLHIDTAAVYGNEKEVGRGIHESEVDREDIFVTTKLWNDVRGYEETKEAFYQSLEKLELDYIDLYLIHWPNPNKYRDNWEEKNAESWKAMEDLVAEGKIKSIGVSNFQQHHLKALMKTAKIKPAVNQIRLTPGDTKDELVQYCREQEIVLEAYSPLGEGELIVHPVLVAMANRYNKTVAQLCLRWSIQKGFIPLPKSITDSRIIANLDIFDFELTEKDVSKMDHIDIEEHLNSANPDEIKF